MPSAARGSAISSDPKPSRSTSSAPAAPSLRVVARAIHLLELLAREPMRPSDICRSLDLPWTSVYRIVTQLAEQRFIEKDPNSGRYHIGQACWLAGSAYTVNHPVVDVARPSLELLSAHIDAVLQLCERANRLALTLLSVHSAQWETVAKTSYGYHFPLHCGSKGQVLLAFAGDDFIEWYLSQPLERLTPETITDPMALRQTLLRIRRYGYAHTEGGVLPTSASIAVPVFGQDHQVVASICATARRQSFADSSAVTAIVDQLRSVALGVSSAVGWRPES